MEIPQAPLSVSDEEFILGVCEDVYSSRYNLFYIQENLIGRLRRPNEIVRILII